MDLLVHWDLTKLCSDIAKKEDDPEQALKEFKVIVDKEEEKGDWLVVYHSNVGVED